mgnify:CR=1 FL=1
MSEENTEVKVTEEQEVTEAKFDGAVADQSTLGSVEVLGGPTPQNSKPDDESNKLKAPSQTQASPPKTKPSAASGQKAEFSTKGDVQAGVELEGENLIEVDVTADVEALTNGEDLSEEFKAKAATIFEAAVVSRLNEELDKVHEEYSKTLNEEVEKVKSELAEQVDEYLTYSVQQWMDKNNLAIEAGLKSEIAESVVSGLKKVFVENYIEVPEEKADIINEMASELDSMESKLNEQVSNNVELTKQVGSFVKNGIVKEISEGLASTEKEKLESLAEGVEFEDEESFRSKVETLKESYFSSKPAKADVETVAEDVQPVVDSEITESMSRYVDALKRFKA